MRQYWVTAFMGLAVASSAIIPRSPADDPRADAAETVASSEAPEKMATKHLPNAVRVHPKVISGGEPAGEAAFEELRKLGVKTVISVDGAKPDVEAARKYGLKYIHLPHGYDGVPAARAQALAKAVREEEGQIYVHCHHGKHRSPAAASVACVAAGLISPSQALPVLQIAGTSPNYRGLFRSAEEAEPIDASVLVELNVEFPETAEIPPMAEAMVAIGHTHHHLQEIAAAGWRSPPDHPDLDPAHEALLLREQYTEMLRADYVQDQPEGFKELLRESEQAAKELETGLREWSRASDRSAPPESLERAASLISANCKACHERYRDVPLGEK